MTLTLTAINGTYDGVGGDQIRRIRYTVSGTNPYTANGELITTLPFTKACYGGNVTMVSQGVSSAALSTAASLAKFRGSSTSTSAIVLQLFHVGLSATANAGLLVDNTTANISNLTFHIEVLGK